MILLSVIWPYIAAMGALIAGLLAVRQSGKTAERGAQAAKALELNEDVAHDRKKVAARSDSSVADELESKWVRKP